MSLYKICVALMMVLTILHMFASAVPGTGRPGTAYYFFVLLITFELWTRL